MTECKKLVDAIKKNSIVSIFQWINSNCECNICSQYNILFNLIDNNSVTILENKHFKKINLTNNMKKIINKEIKNKLIKQKIFKKISK